MDALLEALMKGNFQENLPITSVTAEGMDAGVDLSEATKEGGTLPKSLLVTVEAIHAGMTKNKTFYPADKLEASMHTWTSPYERPVIKNHDTWEEPTGRVIEAYFKDSVLKPETKTIELVLRINDPATIEKVLDKRYQTLSIGGSTNEARCSICAKNAVTEGWCGHSRGKTYEGKEAYWIIGSMEFNEISWVNVPADVNARVISVKPEASPGGRKESVDATNLIDGILNDNTDPAANPVVPVTDPVVPVTEGAEPIVTDPVVPVTEKTDAEKLVEAEAKITELEGNVQTLTDEVTSLKADKVTQDTAIADSAAEVTILKEERDGFRDKNILLAKTAHRFLAERAVDLRVVLGEATKEDRETLVTEYAKTPAKVLESTIKDLLEKPITESATKRTPATPATNPGMVQDSTNHSIEDEGGTITESTSGKEQVVDINVLAERLLKVFSAPQ